VPYRGEMQCGVQRGFCHKGTKATQHKGEACVANMQLSSFEAFSVKETEQIILMTPRVTHHVKLDTQSTLHGHLVHTCTYIHLVHREYIGD